MLVILASKIPLLEFIAADPEDPPGLAIDEDLGVRPRLRHPAIQLGLFILDPSL